MSLLKIANEVDNLVEEEALAAQEEAAAQGRNRTPWIATGAGLGAAGGGAAGAVGGAATGLGIAGLGAGVGAARQALGQGVNTMTRGKAKTLARNVGIAGGLAGAAAGGLTGGLAGKGMSYVPDLAQSAYDNRAEIAQGAKDVGNQVIDQGRALNERLRG